MSCPLSASSSKYHISQGRVENSGLVRINLAALPLPTADTARMGVRKPAACEHRPWDRYAPNIARWLACVTSLCCPPVLAQVLVTADAAPPL